ncbi:MAG: hypothetical protein IPG68_06755 [Micrococcales bacterium]|nr:hypothetical protein [Micrococcales bacterium]
MTARSRTWRSQAAKRAAACGVQSQASEAVDSLTGPVCDGLDQADQSLASLAEGKAATVGEAKQQVAEAKSNLDQAAQDAPAASQAVLSGVSTALDGLAQSLASLKDDSEVPESIATASETIESTISQAQDSLGC